LIKLSTIVFPAAVTPELNKVPVALPISESSNILSETLSDRKLIPALIPVLNGSFNCCFLNLVPLGANGLLGLLNLGGG